MVPAGCDFLDYQERSFADKEDAFSEFSKVTAVLTAAYGCLPSGFSSVDGAMLDAATDDAIYAWNVNNIHNFYNGVWSSKTAVDAQWANFYKGIRRCNNFLENADDRILEEYKWSGDTYQKMLAKWKYYRYEARFLRAFFHFELAKRYGDIPIVDHTLTQEEADLMARDPFDEVMLWIAGECKDIAPNLPVSYLKVPDQETGRATRGAALALRSRALLYLASPLHNPEGSENYRQRWIDAAEAAHDLIEMNIYSNDLRPWSEVFNKWRSNPEVIFEKRMANSRSFEEENTSIGFEGGNSGNCPTQNLVDCYEMAATGKSIDEPGSGYDESAPYAGRDPRFAMTVLYDGVQYRGRSMQCYENGLDGLPKVGASPSGYYLKKMLDENAVISGPNKTATEHCWVLFRYTEILLNYAEAMNEAFGPDDRDRFTLSATDAVNLVRRRPDVKMPDFPSGMSKEEFREKIRNERRVELAFEGHRMWDIRRWKVGNLTKEIYGMDIKRDNITGNVTYSVKKIADRLWEDKMYFYPIPQSEIYATDNVLVQNPGW